jgi:hypothetical protein
VELVVNQERKTVLDDGGDNYNKVFGIKVSKKKAFLRASIPSLFIRFKERCLADAILRTSPSRDQ